MTRILIATALLIAAFTVNAFASNTATVTATVDQLHTVDFTATSPAFSVSATGATYNGGTNPTAGNASVFSNDSVEWTVSGDTSNLKIHPADAGYAVTTTLSNNTGTTSTTGSTVKVGLSSTLSTSSPAGAYTCTLTLSVS